MGDSWIRPRFAQDQPLIREDFHPDLGNSIDFQFSRRRSGKVDNPTALVGTTIIDPDDNLFAIGKVGDPDLGPKRQTRMGRRQGILIKGLTTGGLLSMMSGSIPGCHAILGLLVRRTTTTRQRNREHHSDKDDTTTHGTSLLTTWQGAESVSVLETT